LSYLAVIQQGHESGVLDWLRSHIAEVGGGTVVAVLVLFFGNGILVGFLGLINRQYRWDVYPILSDDRKVSARISNGYPQTRVLSTAWVVVPQSFARQIIWLLLRRERLPRWIQVAKPLAENMELKTQAGVDLRGVLCDDVGLPTWRFWKGFKAQDPMGRRRLLMLAKFDRRRRIKVARVKKVRGMVTQPEESTTT